MNETSLVVKSGFQPPFNSVRKNFGITLLSDIFDEIKNSIFLSPHHIKELFPSRVKPIDHYVIIMNKVFLVAAAEFLPLMTAKIGMTKNQIKQIGLKYEKILEKNITVWVSTCDVHQMPVIPKIMLSLSFWNGQDEKYAGLIHIDKLRKSIIKKINHLVVQKDQNLVLDLSSLGIFNAKTETIVWNSKLKDIHNTLGVGRISEQTLIEVSVQNDIQMMDQIGKTDPNNIFSFSINLKKETSKLLLTRGPLRLSYAELESTLRKNIIEKLWVVGSEMEITCGSNHIPLIVSLLNVEESIESETDLIFKKSEHMKGYYIHQDSLLDFDSVDNRLVLVHTDPVLTDHINFEVTEFTQPKKLKNFSRNDKMILVVDELEKLIKENTKGYIADQMLVFELSTGRVRIIVKSADVRDRFQSNLKKNGTYQWICDEKTIIKIKKDHKCKDLEFVDSNAEKVLSHLHLKLRIPNLLKTVHLSKQKLEEEVRSKLPKTILFGETFEIQISHSHRGTFTLDRAAFDKEDVLQGNYGFFGTMTKDYTLSFEAENKKINIENDEPIDMNLSLEEFLEKEGVGGISKEGILALECTIDSEGIFAPCFQGLGLKRIKGIMFKGPPGNGKSISALAFAKRIVGGDKTRIKQTTGPDLMNSYVGGSEGLIRDLFKDAEESNKKAELKNTKAPIHVIIVDEAEIVFLDRGQEAERNYEISIVNQFLSKMDGDDAVPNVIVIICTNHPNKIDPAARRPGRFDYEVEIGLPNEKGREKIFKIHTKKMFETKKIDPKVSLRLLAKETEDFSGAQIMGVCRTATQLLIRRNTVIFEKKRKENKEFLEGLSPEKYVEKHGLALLEGLITYKDFMEGIKRLKKEKLQLNYYI